MFKKLPKELKELKQWVGSVNNNKIPLKIKDKTYASTSNPDTWGAFEDGLEKIKNKQLDYLGFVFKKGNGYVGIDLDKGKDSNGLLSPVALDIISRCKSYTEESRSGRGFHIFLKGNLSIKGKNNEKYGVEIYDSGRYFITTGKQKFYENIIENQEAIDYIVDKYFPDYKEIKIDKNNSFQKRNVFYKIEWAKPKPNSILLKPIYNQPIQKGCRNQSIASIAGQLFKAGYTKAMVENELYRANAEVCVPQLPSREIQTILKSTERYQS